MDDKRFLRQWKRQLKLAGNKKRRRYLKNLTAHPDDFEFGEETSAVMNEPARPKSRRKPQSVDKWNDELFGA